MVGEMVILQPVQYLRYLLALLVAISAPASTVLADDQISKRLPRIGLLSWSACQSSELAIIDGEWAHFLQGLRELGYAPGKNVTIDCRSAGEEFAHLDSAATELVNIPVDVLISTSGPGAAAVRRATKSIPHAGIDDGLLGNTFAAPGTSSTGLVNSWIILTGKRLEILKEAVPRARKVGVLSNPSGRYQAYEARARRAARDLSLELIFYRVKTPDAFEETFALMKAQDIDAVLLLPDLMFASKAARIADLSIRYNFPSMAWDTRLIEDGFLLAYSSNAAEQEKRLAFYADRILKGALVGQIPVEQPSNFALSVNLRTANAIGLVLPRSIMTTAEKVVE